MSCQCETLNAPAWGMHPRRIVCTSAFIEKPLRLIVFVRKLWLEYGTFRRCLRRAWRWWSSRTTASAPSPGSLTHSTWRRFTFTRSGHGGANGVSSKFSLHISSLKGRCEKSNVVWFGRFSSCLAGREGRRFKYFVFCSVSPVQAKGGASAAHIYIKSP